MEDESTGYGKPPTHAQFKKGQSGNPRGRPKGSRSLRTALERVLREKVSGREGERRRTLSTQDAVLRQLRAAALSGDARSRRDLLSLMMKILRPDDPEPEVQEKELSEAEEEAARAIVERIRNSQP